MAHTITEDRINMQIVLAWLDEDCVMVQEGQRDIGRQHKFKTVPKPMACMWLNKGTAADLVKAQAYAAKDGRTVFRYEREKEPLQRARADILKTAQ
jgi:hypothetical protein